MQEIKEIYENNFIINSNYQSLQLPPYPSNNNYFLSCFSLKMKEELR